MTPIQCFMIHPTERCYRWLRRYVASQSDNRCPAMEGEGSYHQNLVRIEDGDVKVENDGNHEGIYGGERKIYSTAPPTWPRTDERWPRACRCGYEFQEADPRQLFWQVIYRDDAGDEYTLHTVLGNEGGIVSAPAGAMWYADWWPIKPGESPDGRALVVRCPRWPDGRGTSDWMPDGPSLSNPAPAWKRTGVPPNVTATPSIFVSPPSGFHGWLKDGVLTSV